MSSKSGSGSTEFNHKHQHLFCTVLILVVYAAPAGAIAIGFPVSEYWVFTGLSFLLFVCSLFLGWLYGSSPDKKFKIWAQEKSSTIPKLQSWADTLGSRIAFPQSGTRAPETTNTEIPTMSPIMMNEVEADIWLEEYRQISSEARYRDKLLLRSMYFSLAALAALVAIFASGPPNQLQPAVAMIASLGMLAFAIAANSYKDSRDALWDRQRELEEAPFFTQRFSTYQTIREPDLRLANTLSISGYAVSMTSTLFLLTLILYGLLLYGYRFPITSP
ncbi:hypothetical protein BDK88_4382 [Natrinema hispanicum]|uniref:Uncharacterized protein n=1 Tax=Natrinema hispanicum TaxID=392421 RepID=A0A482Y7M9_9EURY|nr:hypothetical protein [Natrinema hispanicum]RZV05138.1 hypothetical protein BDK88_4382 [Natrinema hispanicum]